MQFLLLATSRINRFQRWRPAPLTRASDDGTAFFCMKPANAVRRGCSRFVESRPVQISWFVLVCLSTAMTLAIQPRDDMGGATHTTLYVLQVVCLAFFWVRMVAEIVACGLIGGSHGFLRSVWSWIEVAVNVLGLLQVIPFTFRIRWMRAFEAARPLRFFASAPCWRPLLLPLGRAFPCLFDAMVTLGLCLLALALIGVMEVGEELEQRCCITNATASSPHANLTLPFLLRNVSAACGVGFSCPAVSADVMVQCLAIPNALGNRFFAYGNVGAALLLTFKVASMDMWFEDLEAIMNAKGAGAALYLVAVALVAFFFVTLFTSIVYSAYANLNTCCAPSSSENGGPAVWRRRDCSVQTSPARPPMQQALSLRPADVHERTYSEGGHRGAVDDARGQKPLGGDDSGGRVATDDSCIASEGGAAVRTCPRDVRGLKRDYQKLGYGEALRALEATTTAGAGGAPLLPRVASVVNSVPFVILLMALSASNIVLLAAVSTSTPDSAARILHIISAALAIFFIVPAALRLIAFGVVRAMTDVWNYADVLGAASGVAELAAPSLFHYRVVGVVRVLRYVRVAKYLCPLYRYEYHFKTLIGLLLFIFATLTLYALVGMQLFAGTYDAAAAPAPIRNGDFNTVWTALLACFRAFTGDMWTRYMLAVSEGGNIATGSVFFVSLQLCAQVMVFALGYSIIIPEPLDSACDEGAPRCDEFPPLLLLPPLKPDNTTATGAAVDGSRDGGDLCPSPDGGTAFDRWRWRRAGGRQVAGVIAEKCFRAHGDAFLLFGSAHPVRVLLLRVLGSPIYTFVSTLCVAIGVVALFFERRRLSDDTEQTLHLFNVVYLVVFGVEMIMKWVAFGVVAPGTHRGETHNREDHAQCMPAYFRYPLNWVDFAANTFALAAVFYPSLRVGRVLRTVRLFTTQERPNKSFVQLVKLLRHTVRVVPLLFFLYVAFAVAAMQMFAGGLFRCNDAAVTDPAMCFGDYNITVEGYTGSITILQKRALSRAAFHYDAFGSALLSVFAMTTVNHWGDFADDAMAITSKMMSYNHSGFFVIFFIVALLLIRFFAVRAIAVVFVVELRRVTAESLDMTQRAPNQARFLIARECIAYMTQLQRLVTPLPTAVSRVCHRILSAQPANWPNTPFSFFVQAVLVIACGFVAATQPGEPLWRRRMISAMDCAAVAVCGAEVVLGFLAYGMRHLTRASYAADVALFVLMVVGVASPLLRFMRVAIFVKLMKHANTGLALLPAARHIRLLLSSSAIALLVLFSYGVVGTLLLGDIAPDGVYLTEKRNFSTVVRSLLVLLDCSTFDQWHLVMHACFDGAACRSSTTATCGHTYTAVIFFVSFIVIQSLVVGQLLFATIVVVFAVPLFGDVVEPFIELRRAWHMGVGAGKSACDFDTFLALLPRFPASLTGGICSKNASEAELIAFLSSLRLPLDEHARLRYEDVIRSFAYRKYNIVLTEEHTDWRARDRLSGLTAGEYYRQLLLRTYCDHMSRLARAKVDGMRHLSTKASVASPSHDGVGDHDVFRLNDDDLIIPKGALPIPCSNIFLYTFPGEGSRGGVVLPTSQ
ncbi:hypothetical protein JIQ42_07407 [Leishmania sp. Namibia]|uniref:hypothetical protein n=1 Tax=Leishmania sp. Namibia TaxID=2802991 RepID=UPI001B5675DB|nr:hypothetical protein JIQ42_07407 [Leishmania sp. Namibia]